MSTYQQEQLAIRRELLKQAHMQGATSYYTAEQEQAWLDTFTPEWQRWP